MDRSTAGRIQSLEAKLVIVGNQTKRYQRLSGSSLDINDRRYYRDLANSGKREAGRLEAQIKKLRTISQ